MPSSLFAFWWVAIIPSAGNKTFNISDFEETLEITVIMSLF